MAYVCRMRFNNLYFTPHIVMIINLNPVIFGKQEGNKKHKENSDRKITEMNNSKDLNVNGKHVLVLEG
jgi:hypothetical protein